MKRISCEHKRICDQVFNVDNPRARLCFRIRELLETDTMIDSLRTELLHFIEIGASPNGGIGCNESKIVIKKTS